MEDPNDEKNQLMDIGQDKVENINTLMEIDSCDNKLLNESISSTYLDPAIIEESATEVCIEKSTNDSILKYLESANTKSLISDQLESGISESITDDCIFVQLESTSIADASMLEELESNSTSNAVLSETFAVTKEFIPGASIYEQLESGTKELTNDANTNIHLESRRPIAAILSEQLESSSNCDSSISGHCEFITTKQFRADNSICLQLESGTKETTTDTSICMQLESGTKESTSDAIISEALEFGTFETTNDANLSEQIESDVCISEQLELTSTANVTNYEHCKSDTKESTTDGCLSAKLEFTSTNDESTNHYLVLNNPADIILSKQLENTNTEDADISEDCEFTIRKEYTSNRKESRTDSIIYEQIELTNTTHVSVDNQLEVTSIVDPSISTQLESANDSTMSDQLQYTRAKEFAYSNISTITLKTEDCKRSQEDLLIEYTCHSDECKEINMEEVVSEATESIKETLIPDICYSDHCKERNMIEVVSEATESIKETLIPDACDSDDCKEINMEEVVSEAMKSIKETLIPDSCNSDNCKEINMEEVVFDETESIKKTLTPDPCDDCKETNMEAVVIEVTESFKETLIPDPGDSNHCKEIIMEEVISDATASIKETLIPDACNSDDCQEIDMEEVEIEAREGIKKTLVPDPCDSDDCKEMNIEEVLIEVTENIKETLIPDPSNSDDCKEINKEEVVFEATESIKESLIPFICDSKEIESEETEIIKETFIPDTSDSDECKEINMDKVVIEATESIKETLIPDTSNSNECKEIDTEELRSKATESMNDNSEMMDVDVKSQIDKYNEFGESSVKNICKDKTEINGSKLPNDVQFSKVILIGDSFVNDLYHSWPQDSVFRPYFISKNMETIEDMYDIIKHPDFLMNCPNSLVIFCLGITDVIELIMSKNCCQLHNKIKTPATRRGSICSQILKLSKTVRYMYPDSCFIFANLPNIGCQQSVFDILTNYKNKWKKCTCEYEVPYNSQKMYNDEVNKLNHVMFYRGLSQIKSSQHLNFYGLEVLFNGEEWKLPEYSKLSLATQIYNKISAVLMPVAHFIKSETNQLSNSINLESIPIYILGEEDWLNDVSADWSYDCSICPFFYPCQNVTFAALKEFILSTILPEEPCVILTSIGNEFRISYDEHQCDTHPSVKYPIPKTSSNHELREDVLKYMNDISNILESRNKCKLYYITCYTVPKKEYIKLLMPPLFNGKRIKCDKHWQPRKIRKVDYLKYWMEMQNNNAIVDETIITYNMQEGAPTFDINVLKKNTCPTRKNVEEKTENTNLLKYYLHSLSKLISEGEIIFDNSMKPKNKNSFHNNNIILIAATDNYESSTTHNEILESKFKAVSNIDENIATDNIELSKIHDKNKFDRNFQVLSECIEGENLSENDHNLSNDFPFCTLEQEKKIADSFIGDRVVCSAVDMDAESINIESIDKNKVEFGKSDLETISDSDNLKARPKAMDKGGHEKYQRGVVVDITNITSSNENHAVIESSTIHDGTAVEFSIKDDSSTTNDCTKIDTSTSNEVTTIDVSTTKDPSKIEVTTGKITSNKSVIEMNTKSNSSTYKDTCTTKSNTKNIVTNVHATKKSAERIKLHKDEKKKKETSIKKQKNFKLSKKLLHGSKNTESIIWSENVDIKPDNISSMNPVVRINDPSISSIKESEKAGLPTCQKQQSSLPDDTFVPVVSSSNITSLQSTPNLQEGQYLRKKDSISNDRKERRSVNYGSPSGHKSRSPDTYSRSSCDRNKDRSRRSRSDSRLPNRYSRSSRDRSKRRRSRSSNRYHRSSYHSTRYSHRRSRSRSSNRYSRSSCNDRRNRSRRSRSRSQDRYSRSNHNEVRYRKRRKSDDFSRKSSSSGSLSSVEKSSRMSIERIALNSLWDVHQKECAMYRNNPEAHPDYGKEKRHWFGIMATEHGYTTNSYFLQEKWKSVWMQKMEEHFKGWWEEKKNKCISMLPICKRSRSRSRSWERISKKNKRKSERSSGSRYSPRPSDEPSKYPVDSMNALEVQLQNFVQKASNSFSGGVNSFQQSSFTTYPLPSASCLQQSAFSNLSTSYPSTSVGNSLKQSPFSLSTAYPSNTSDKGSHFNQRPAVNSKIPNVLDATSLLCEISDRFGNLGPYIKSLNDQLMKDNFRQKNLLEVLMEDDALLLLKMISEKLSRFLGDPTVSIVQKAIYLEAQEKLANVLKAIKDSTTPFNELQLESLRNLTVGMDMIQILKLIKENLKLMEGTEPDDQKVMGVYMSLKAIDNEKTNLSLLTGITPSFNQLMSHVGNRNAHGPNDPTSSLYGIVPMKTESKIDKIKKEFRNMSNAQRLDRFRNFNSLAFEEKSALLSYLDETEQSNPHFAKVLRMIINDPPS